MAWYRTGTVSVTNGSTTVTGAGTDFITNSAAGEAFIGLDGKMYEIDSITSSTVFLLKTIYLGTTLSGQAYVIAPTQAYIRSLAANAASLIATYSTALAALTNGRFGDGTAAVPGITFAADQDTGFYRYAANTIGITTNGVQAVVVDGSQNVGIGGASTGSKLQVFGTTYTASLATGTAASAYFPAGYSINQVGSWSTFGESGYDAGAFICHGANNNTTANDSGWTYRYASSPATRYKILNGSFSWFIAPGGSAGASISWTETMRLDPSGRLMVGRTTVNAAGPKIAVEGRIDSVVSTVGAFSFGASSTSQAFVINDTTTGSELERLRIDSGGNVRPGADNAYTLGSSSFRFASIWGASGVVSTSDARTKTNVANATLGLNFIKALRPVSYKFVVGRNDVTAVPDGFETVEQSAAYMDAHGQLIPAKTAQRQKYKQQITPVAGSRTHWGLIAQEVKTAVDAAGVDFAGWVLADALDPTSAQGLRYEHFISPLIKAVQEQQVMIDILIARVDKLESKGRV